MATPLRTLRDALIDFLWPGVCPGCEGAMEADRLCAGCKEGLAGFSSEERSVVHGDDLPVIALHPYAEPLRSILLRVKYAPSTHGLEALAALLAEAARDPTHLGHPDGVVPLPMTRARLRQRGFNQSLWLARPLARRLRVPLETKRLARRGRHAPQASLDGAARRQNLAGAFVARRVRGRALLLVDDVVTTGTTLVAAAQALRTAGARRVTALCLLRVEKS